jgi:CheY-like chemotaxis protein/anti-sigma regulatory factor (Ser/Thr protein kinase)
MATTMQPDTYTIVVVDDEPVIRRLLRTVLQKRGYAVREAASGAEALRILATEQTSMVISDIQMPGMNGFELLAHVQERFPRVKRVLMTAFDIDEYIALVRERDVGNILPKGAGFQLEEIERYVSSLLRGDVFGLQRYFPATAIRTESIRSHDQARTVCASIVETTAAREPLFLEMAIDELISNAVFHGALRLHSRDQWDGEYVLDEGGSVSVSWARDDERIGVAVVDRAGNLRKVDALRWIDHPLHEELGGEEHGRGLQLVRRLVDRFIINIELGHRTECILLQYHDPTRAAGQKPLLIHEL